MPKKPLRLPNGFGSITVLKGRRRKPFQAKTPTMGYRYPSGTPIQKSLGCYETYQQAYEAILAWHNHTNPSAEAKLTFKDCYEAAIAEMRRSSTPRAENTYKTYQSRFNALRTLHSVPIADLRLSDLQRAVDATRSGHSTRSVTITVCHIVYAYACKHDLCDKDYSQYLDTNTASAKADPDKYFTDAELAVLKRYADTDDTARRLIVMCYTGFRYTAYETWEVHLEEGYVSGGVKQKRSKEYKPRIVPIHPAIKNYIVGLSFPDLQTFARRMDAFLKEHGMRRLTPHATRHTMSYLLDKAGVDDVTAKMLMGHSLGSDVHANVYKHRSFEQLKEAIEALPY